MKHTHRIFKINMVVPSIRDLHLKFRIINNQYELQKEMNDFLSRPFRIDGIQFNNPIIPPKMKNPYIKTTLHNVPFALMLSPSEQVNIKCQIFVKSTSDITGYQSLLRPAIIINERPQPTIETSINNTSKLITIHINTREPWSKRIGS